jgi:hypothetical protein
VDLQQVQHCRIPDRGIVRPVTDFSLQRLIYFKGDASKEQGSSLLKKGGEIFLSGRRLGTVSK